MKNKFKNLRRLVAASILAGLAFILQPAAQAQVSPAALFQLTNLPPTLASNVVANMTNIVSLTKNCCLAVAGKVNTSSGAGSEIISGSFSTDGTNFGAAPFTLTAPLSTVYPTNTVTVWTNWSQAYLSGFAAVNFTLATNTGPGTATNLDWKVNRPTLNTATY